MDQDSSADWRLGELIAAAFDEAARYSEDPAEISRLATGAVVHFLERTRRRSASNDPEPPSIVKVLPPAAHRMVASALRLVPREGPRVRVGRSSVLRLIRAPVPEPPVSDAEAAQRVPRLVD